jgi:excisionase family DNA binding protein
MWWAALALSNPWWVGRSEPCPLWTTHRIPKETEMPRKSRPLVAKKPPARTVSPSRSAESRRELDHSAPASRSASPNRDRDYRTLVELHPDEPLSIAESATYLGVTQRWIRRHIALGEFEIARRGKLVRIRKGVLVEYENRQTEPARDGVG